jgi:hypothetical protein
VAVVMAGELPPAMTFFLQLIHFFTTDIGGHVDDL